MHNLQYLSGFFEDWLAASVPPVWGCTTSVG